MKRTKEECIASAKKWGTLKEWRAKSYVIYMYSMSKGWLDDCTAHMKPSIHEQHKFRTKQDCINDAKEHKTLKEWYTKNFNSYRHAKNKGWLDECTTHMK